MSGNEDVHVARARIKYRLSTWTRDCHVHNMGCREQKERERNRAAAMSQSLQKFLLPKKKTAVNTEGDAAASGSQIG